MRKFSLLYSFVLLNIFCDAQSTDLHTTCATAYENSSGGVIITYTIGEMVLTDTWISSTMMISQGIIQPINNAVTGLIYFTSSELKVYPNPTSDALIISINNGQPGKYSFEIFDVTGKKLIGQERFSSGNFLQQLNLSRVVPGPYFLKINFVTTSGDLKTGIYKIIKVQ